MRRGKRSLFDMQMASIRTLLSDIDSQAKEMQDKLTNRQRLRAGSGIKEEREPEHIVLVSFRRCFGDGGGGVGGRWRTWRELPSQQESRGEKASEQVFWVKDSLPSLKVSQLGSQLARGLTLPRLIRLRSLSSLPPILRAKAIAPVSLVRTAEPEEFDIGTAFSGVA